MISFDNTINLGHILTFVGFIGAAMGGFYAVKGRLIAIEVSNENQTKLIGGMQDEIKGLSKVVIDVALQHQRLDTQAERITQMEKRQDERLAAMERRWEEVRRGDGLIVRE